MTHMVWEAGKYCETHAVPVDDIAEHLLRWWGTLQKVLGARGWITNTLIGHLSVLVSLIAHLPVYRGTIVPICGWDIQL